MASCVWGVDGPHRPSTHHCHFLTSRTLIRNHDLGQASRPGAYASCCPSTVSNEPTGAVFLALEDGPSLKRLVNISHWLQKIRQLVCQVPDFLPPSPPFSLAFQMKLCTRRHSSNPGALVPCCHTVTGAKKPQLSASCAFTVPLATVTTEIIVSSGLHQWKAKDAEILFFPSGLPNREDNHFNRTVFP